MRLDLNRITLLDGAMGTMLHQEGLKPGELPELVALTRPELLISVHRRYIEAGAGIIYANTFGANRRKFAGMDVTTRQVVAAAVAAAKQAAEGTDTLVAVDMGPIGELLAPLGSLDFEEAVSIFAEVARAGEEAGADLAVIETMTDLQEARAALLAVKENTHLPVLVTMSFEERGRTFTGCTVASMARTLEGLGADAIGLNCSLGPAQVLPMVKELCRNTRLPVIAKPNAGLPDPLDGHYDLPPEAFAQAMKALVEAGASLVGGCCGTSPAYIAALRDAVKDMHPGKRVYEAESFVCTATRALPIRGVEVIGERINPTGKKRLQKALLEDDLDYLVEVAVAQQDAGAAILDVNVGYPGVDEAVMLPRVVQKLQAAVDLPLQLDSGDPRAIEAALRVYCGKAAVNSVSGKDASMAELLPVVKKYGAAVVGLCLDDKGLPSSCEERVTIARRILAAAQAQGIPKEDVWIDCLTLTVSAQQDQAAETLRAVRTVRHEMGLNTVLGVSNISFGLPERSLMTQTFLISALNQGLTLPILNPNQTEIMDAVAAWRALSGADQGCGGYVERFAGRQPRAAEPMKAMKPASAPAVSDLGEAIARGMQGDAARMAREALAAGTELELVENILIPALDKVGADYESGRAFLPQLLAAAQAAQSVFGVIKESLAQKGGETVRKGRLLIATVQGDIHDIGKNIVRTVLENYGYEVLDLGRDVPPEIIVETVWQENIRLVGLSALMTTTLPAMEETVRQLKRLADPPEIMVGGAVVTEAYARGIGACYVKDARASVAVARRIFA